MSKRNRRSRQSQKPEVRAEKRDYLHIPTRTVRASPTVIRALEDRRYYAPGDTYPRGLFHRSTRAIVAQPNVNERKRNDPPHRIMFNVPDEVAVCVRRKQRREVLFAKRLTRKGAGSKKRWTAMSERECK